LNIPKEILVVRLSSLGDVILTFPFLKLLKKYYPDYSISYLTKPEFLHVIEMNPYVNNILSYSPKINLKKYDIIFNLQNNLKSNLLISGKSDNIYYYKKDNSKKFLLVKFKVNLFNTITPVFLKYIQSIPEYINLTPDEKKFSLTELLFIKTSKINEKYIVVSPSAKHFTKRYPKEKFIDLLNLLNKNFKVILTGSNSNEDTEICSYISSNVSNSLNLCGLLTIPELSTYIYFSEFVISNDSAVMHLTEALGKKVYAVFGSTVKEFGFFPQLESSVVFEVNGLKCRPCSHIGRSSCPEGHFKCMNDNPVSTNLIKNLSIQ